MAAVMGMIAGVSLLIWVVLLFFRGGFWKVRLPVKRQALPLDKPWPNVVAVVPARNEADVIHQAVTSLLAQNYEGALSVVVVDDHSVDGTAAIARAAAVKLGGTAPSRLHVIQARDLPAGWSGKVWAQSEGVAAQAEHFPGAEWIWLTDADIVHPTEGLTHLVVRAVQDRLDLVSLMVRLRCDSPAERRLIPAFVYFFAKLYPFSWVSDLRRKTAGAAGGCMLLRRTALERVGGMASIKGALIDDCSLAAEIKRHGGIRLDLADHALSIRPYDGWQDIWRMIARTAYTQLHYSPWALLGATVGMVLTYIVPPVLSLVGVALGQWWAAPALLAWAGMIFSYQPMLRYYRQPAWHALLLPAVAGFYLAATLDSGRRHWLGRGGEWKGRAQANNVNTPTTAAAAATAATADTTLTVEKK